MSSTARGLLLALVAALVPSVAAAARPTTGYVMTEQPGVLPDLAGGAPTIFYINKNGGQFRAANSNDARNNNSTIVSSGIASVPAWNISAANWNTVKTCIADMFE